MELQQAQAPKLEMDEVDAEILMERTHALLETVLARELPKTLRGDLLQLYKDIDDVLASHFIH
jgi:hypothetical protein